jgi:hypothetical protein
MQDTLARRLRKENVMTTIAPLSMLVGDQQHPAPLVGRIDPEAVVVPDSNIRESSLAAVAGWW